MQQRNFFCLGLILLLSVSLSNSFMFELEVDQEKCFRDDLSHDAVVLGEYDVSSSFNTLTSIKVFDPSGQQVWNTDSAAKGSFAFTTDRAGEVKVCFLDTLREGNRVPPHNKRQARFQLKTGASAKDYANVAKKEDLKPLELELITLEDLIYEINTDMKYLRSREANMRETSESTNTRLLWLSILTMGCLLGLGVFQIYYLKRFFQQKKLL